MAPTRRFTPRQSLVISAVVLLMVSPAAAQRVRQISDFLVHDLGSYAVDDNGSAAFFTADVDPLGTNPDVVMQVFRVALPGGALTQLTALDADARDVAVSDDGSTILFVSSADPLGTNADRSAEIFLADGGGSSLVQLTDHPGGGGGVDLAVLSGDAGTVAFVTNGDLTGANPSGYAQLFASDTDGTGIVQLTTAVTDGWIGALAISDDGSRIAFTDNRDLAGFNPDGQDELFSVLANGTSLIQVTRDVQVNSLALSGLGNAIAFADNADNLYTVPWGSIGPTLRDTDARDPSLTDNGSLIYYGYGGSETIRMFDAKVGSPVGVWRDGTGVEPVISGTGNRMVFRLFRSGDPELPYLGSPYSRGLIGADGAGESAEEIVDVGEIGNVWQLEMSADGAGTVFPWGASADLHLADTESGEVVPLPYSGFNPAINGDASMIVFDTTADLLPDECPGADGGIYCIGADGTGLRQLAPDPATCISAPLAQHAMLSNESEQVVFQSAGDPSGIDTGGGAELYGVAGAGGPVGLVTNDDSDTYKNPRIDGSGTWTVYHSDSDITGQNPSHQWQVFKIRMDGTGVEQLSTNGGIDPDVNSGGSKIVYCSDADPLGTNADGNLEIFLYDTTTTTTEQLTVTANGDNTSPRISPNGEYVAFGSTSPWVSSSLGEAVYRIELATGELLLASAGTAWVNRSHRDNGTIDVSDSGSVAFVSANDLVRRNPDHNLEFWLAEFDAMPTLEASVESPTVVRWDPLPWALSYDVIRGDAASLAAGGGGSVDLGAVVCLENGSTDATTFGFGDDVEPGAGEVLFYLFREWGGDLVGDGDWGTGSGGAERIPGSGSCPAGP